MKISAIIPTYNRADFIAEAIESVQNQTYSIDEIIIVDDGSNDTTCSILKKFDVKVIKTQNFGVSHARNLGIKEAKNDWVAFLDSDDLWMKEKIKKQVTLHKKYPDLLFSHTFERWEKNGKVAKYPKRLAKPFGFCFLDNISTCKIACSSVLVHKSIFEKVGYFDENLKVCEDYDLWLRITNTFEIGLIKEECITKRAGHKQLSNEIFAIDAYHVDSLLKFLDTKYKDEVKKEIVKKCQILLKGAIKHENQEIYKKCKLIFKKLDIIH